MNPLAYCFDADAVADFAALCARFSGHALRSPYRSTVPLLNLVEHGQVQWLALLEALGAPADAKVHFEFGVASPKPGGNPSQTDALIASASTVWAVEAKWTEPRYGTVADRVRKPEADGADPRVTVTGWLKHLQPFARHELQLDAFSDVVYQMLHRAASACAVATAQRRRPQLVYLHFHPSPLRSSATTDQYLADLGRLHALLGSPAELPFSVVEMALAPTPAFDAIKDLDKRSPATAARVVEALCRGPLFIFGTPKMQRVEP